MNRKQYFMLVISLIVTYLAIFAVDGSLASTSASAPAQNTTTGKEVQTKYTFIEKWGSFGTGPGQFNRPHDVAFDSTGNVYVDELERAGVQVFDSEGNFLRKWGSVGTADGQFSLPQEHLWIDSKDHLYLVDGDPNPRIQIFDPNGNVLGKVASPCKMSTGDGCIDPDGAGPLSLGDGQFSKPEHVAINSEGKMYIVDRGNDLIQVFAAINSTTENVE